MQRSGTRYRERGFTLLEMLLSVGIIGMMAMISLPIYNGFAVRNDLDIHTQQVVAMLRRAQTYARGMQNDSVWGVNVAASTITLFKGTSFGGRDTTFDETITLPGSMSASTSEVQFAKFTAIPNVTGTVTTITSNANETRTITLNGRGMVNF